MRAFVAGALFLGLIGCAGGTPAAVTGVAALTPAVLQAAGVGAPVLSDVALAACAAEAAANSASKIAVDSHNSGWAARFADASQLTGLACAW